MNDHLYRGTLYQALETMDGTAVKAHEAGFKAEWSDLHRLIDKWAATGFEVSYPNPYDHASVSVRAVKAIPDRPGYQLVKQLYFRTQSGRIRADLEAAAELYQETQHNIIATR